jgi:YVTN family beta-propeller protein
VFAKFTLLRRFPPVCILLLVFARSSFFAQTSTSASQQGGGASAGQGTPSFEVFKKEVEPIFLKERPGHARCYGCHTLPGRVFHLQPLPAGSDSWTEEQSQQNFESVLRVVDLQDPASSRLLLHPLAPEAGGDAFHSGGRQFESQNDPDWRTLELWVTGGQAEGGSAGARSWIYVTNSAADSLDIIDTTTNRVVQVIRGIELPHGVNFSRDGTRVYVSNESESVLDVVDRKSGAILQKVRLSGRPNNITVTKDGERVLVGIRAKPGSIDVIDTNFLRVVKNVPVDGPVHNLYVTPDGKYVVSGSIENKAVTVVDLSRDEVAWVVKLDAGVRPMAFDTNPDGSTKRIFVQLSGLNGFAVVDFAKRAEVDRTKLPDNPGGFGEEEGRMGTPSHGIGVTPDGKSLWVNSTLANATFKYSLPDLKLVGYVKLPEVHGLSGPASGAVPEWITFTADGKRVYVSNSAARSISVIDSDTLKQVAIIPVGEVPKRINTLALTTQ